jgi:ABC-2 type transport system permease protein
MGPILAIAFKDLRILSRHRLALFWVLGFPLLMALFFGAIFSSGASGQHAMKIAIVDQDRSDFSRKFAETLRKSDALRVSEMPLDSARVLVRQGRLVAYVLLPAGIGDSFGFGGGDSTRGLEVGIDPSRHAEQGYLRGLLTQAVFGAMQGQFGAGGSGRDAIRRNIARVRADSTRSPEERGRTTHLFEQLDEFMTALDSSQAGRPDTAASATSAAGFGGPAIRMVPIAEGEDGPRSGYEITFPSSLFWAFIGVCSSFAISIVSERTRGTFLRLRLAPISRSHVLAGKGLACLIAGLGVTTLLMGIATTVFHVRVPNPPALAAALVASALCFVGLMMLISTLGRDERAVSGAGWAILLMQSMIGGGMIPLIAMPPWLQTLSHFSVVKWGVLAVEGAIWRGFSWGEMALPLGILLAVGVAGFAIGAMNLSRADS